MAASPSPRGFAAMSPERRREIATLGGRGVPADKRAYSQNRALAVSAGRKGGEASQRAKRTESDQ